MTGLIFLNPLFLFSLLALPAIWYLLKFTPPEPKDVALPTASFLKGLEEDEHTPAKTPWWLIALRILVFTLVVLALARPVFNPAQDFQGRDNVMIILDNGWSAAQVWSLQKKAALEILAQAREKKQPVRVIMTAPEPGRDTIFDSEVIRSDQARSIINGARIRPWEAQYDKVTKTLSSSKAPFPDTAYWLSDGIKSSGFDDLASLLNTRSRLIFYKPDPFQMSLLIKSGEQTDQKGDSYEFHILRPAHPEAQAVTLSAGLFDPKGQLLKTYQKAFSSSGPDRDKITISAQKEVLSGASHLQLSREPGAGGSYYFAQRYKIKHVGIASSRSGKDTTPFVESEYYLQKALKPHAQIQIAPPEALISAGVSMIIAPDLANMPKQTEAKLETWLEKGGWLVYFSGPNIASQSPAFSPVRLRKGGRALEGVMTWEQPLAIGEFPENTPFAEFEIPEDVKITQMVLAQPDPDLESRTWARLEDGTPLITSKAFKKGRVVLVHTSASPKWSDLPLSGLYVRLLKRMTDLAGYSQELVEDKRGVYKANQIITGKGLLEDAPSHVKAIPAEDFDQTRPTSQTPPGLYEKSGLVRAMNIGDRIETLDAVQTLPSGVLIKAYERITETRLMPLLMTLAFILMLFDWGIRLWIGRQFSARTFWPGAAVRLKRGVSSLFILCGCALVLFISAENAKAQAANEDIEYAGRTYLAYIQTPSERVNRISRLGLENLAEILKMRTSVEPAGVAELNISQDSLALFPLIYWPVTADAPSLRPGEAEKIQKYMDNGGMILFDTMDQPRRMNVLEEFVETSNSRALKRILSPVNVPALVPVPEEHVLTKSFYLLQSFPGQYAGGQLWIEKSSADPESRTGLDGVTRVLIGSHNWAAAWASDGGGGDSGLFGGSRQQEMAYRFGVNLMMYALTGNYKSDQVHVPFILERLGQ